MASDHVPLAALDDVTHRCGTIEALSRVTLALAPGQVTALLGPNGAGKTTVVRLLCGLARPSSGTARLVGGNPQDAARRRGLGVMLQVARVPESLTVREHVHLFSSYYDSPLPLDRVLALAGLEDVVPGPRALTLTRDPAYRPDVPGPRALTLTRDLACVPDVPGPRALTLTRDLACVPDVPGPRRLTLTRNRPTYRRGTRRTMPDELTS